MLFLQQGHSFSFTPTMYPHDILHGHQLILLAHPSNILFEKIARIFFVKRNHSVGDGMSWLVRINAFPAAGAFFWLGIN